MFSPHRTVGIFVTIEGFLLYAGGDYALILNIMLLVQVMAYVMSSTFAVDIVGRWTCALESGPLIGSPVATILPVLRARMYRANMYRYTF